MKVINVVQNPSLILYKEDEFVNLVKGEKYEIYDINSINKIRLDLNTKMRQNPEHKQEILEKANKEFSELQRVEVKYKTGLSKPFFIREKINLIKGGEGFQQNQQEGQQQQTQSTDITDEEFKMLSLLNQVISAGDGTDIETIEDADDFADEETKKILQSLQSKGLIELDDNDGVKAITDSGKQALDNAQKGSEGDGSGSDGQQQPVQQTQQEQDGAQQNQQGQGAEQQNQQEGVQNQQQQEEGVEQGSQQNQQEGQQQNQQEGVQNQQEGEGDGQQNVEEQNAAQQQTQEGAQQGQQDNGGEKNNQEELEAYASKTPTEDLQKFVDNKNSDPTIVEVAKKELEKRASGGQQQEGQQNGQQGQQQGAQNQQQDEEDEGKFVEWVNGHFDEYDKEDLQKFTADLINQSPGERKVLLDHYRSDYKSKNGGNSVSKIDDKEFGEWLIEYLEHQPFPHLKKYCIELCGKNPKAFNNLKGTYKSLKDNKMIN